MTNVVLRTHGGLGNQLFQVLFGRLLAEEQKCELREIHDLRYKHQFGRTPKLITGRRPTSFQCVISSLRVPKVLHRMGWRQEGPWKLGYSWYLDAYFQDVSSYQRFDEESIRRHLRALALELGIQPAHKDTYLMHLRIGDFFGDRDAARIHVLNRLDEIPHRSMLLTNDETLLNEDDVAAVMLTKQVQLVPSGDFEALDVLRVMSRHRVINANDSTLTVWAHILAGSHVNFKDPRLSALAGYFGRIGKWH